MYVYMCIYIYTYIYIYIYTHIHIYTHIGDPAEPPDRWSWHDALGLEPESEPDIARCRVQLRRRARGAGHGSPPCSGKSECDEGLVQEDGQSYRGTLMGMLAFAAIYMSLRLAAKVGHWLLA